MRSFNSSPDPMAFINGAWGGLSDGRRAADVGKVGSDPRLVPGERVAVFILAGQSLMSGTSGGPYTPVNATKCDAVDIYGGGLQRAADPLPYGLGPDPLYQSNPFTRVADMLITNGKYDRVILVPVAYGGTKVDRWDSELYTLIIAGHRRAKALGINIVTLKIWQQGESDSSTATETTYSTSWLSMKAKVDAEVPGPWMVAKSTYVPGGSTNAGIRAASASFVDNSTVFAGPDFDSFGASYRYDDQHWNAAGNLNAANLYYASVVTALGL